MAVVGKINVPHESLVDDHVTVIEIMVNTGERVEEGQDVLVVETSKAAITLESPAEGYVFIHCAVGEEKAYGALLAEIHDTSGGIASPEKEKDGEDSAVKPPDADHERLYSPKALELIQHHKLAPDAFSDMDIVTSDLVLARVRGGDAAPQSVRPAPPPKKALVPFTSIPFTPSKKQEIAYLTDVQSANLNSTVWVDVQVAQVYQTLQDNRCLFPKILTPLVAFEMSRLLREFSQFNGFFRDSALNQYDEVNVGVAVDTGNNLKVLNIRACDTLTFSEVEQRLTRLFEKYETNTLAIEDLSGTTITLTDLASLGADMFIPLINQQQAAILGISAMTRLTGTCKISLTFDHRVATGRDASLFLVRLKERLEQYALSSTDVANLHCSRCLKTIQEDRKAGGKGFVKTLDHQGREQLLCYTCFNT
jgi:pyruvate/2-oxoglutarate dehydrogenase complex dihydrolipoamide acyltransferase (E2) component